MSITAILRLLTLVLELWVLRESRREQRELEQDEKEINRLRSLGDPASQLLADRLRARVLRSAGIVSKVYTEPTSSSSSVGQSNSPNEGRSLDSKN